MSFVHLVGNSFQDALSSDHCFELYTNICWDKLLLLTLSLCRSLFLHSLWPPSLSCGSWWPCPGLQPPGWRSLQLLLGLHYLICCTSSRFWFVILQRLSKFDLLKNWAVLILVLARFRPCELALALLCTEFQLQCAENPSNTTALMGFVSELQKYCNIQNSDFMTVLTEVVAILEKYNGEGQVPHRQRLVWKLSNRTLRHLRPTDRLRPTLPKICEESVSDKSAMSRLRSASECSLESDLSDSDVSYKAGGSDSESDVEMEVRTRDYDSLTPQFSII